MAYCATCRKNKKRIYFNQDRALEAAKKLAIERQETYAIYREGRSVSFTTAAEAIAGKFDIVCMVSQHL